MRLISEVERNGDLPKALELTEEVLREKPEDLALNLAVVRLMIKLQRLPEAQKSLELLLKLHPENPSVLAYLGMILDNPLMPKRDAVSAESYLLLAIEKNPKDKSVYLPLGEMFQTQGRFKQAAYIYTGLLTLVPENSAARLQLSKALDSLGQKEKASEQARIAQSLIVQEQDESRLVTQRDQKPSDALRRWNLAQHYLKYKKLRQYLPELQATFALNPHLNQTRTELENLYKQANVPTPDFLKEK